MPSSKEKMKTLLALLATAQIVAAFAPQTTPLYKSLHQNTLINKEKIAKVASSPAVVCPRAESTALFGIPKMFRWLTDQYPNINSRLNEGLGTDKVVDNFYLDMNGIIHPCTHGNSDEIVVLDETAMFKKIFSYVDR